MCFDLIQFVLYCDRFAIAFVSANRFKQIARADLFAKFHCY